MKKLLLKNLDELAKIMPVISELEQRSYIGGGNGTQKDPYTVEEFYIMSANKLWTGGYVVGWGYTFADAVATGSYSSGNSNNIPGSSGYWGYDIDGSGYINGNSSNPSGGSSGNNDDTGYWDPNNGGYIYGSGGGGGGGATNGGNNNGGSTNPYVNPNEGYDYDAYYQYLASVAQTHIISQASIKGIDLSKMDIVYDPRRPLSVAWVLDDNKMYVSQSFFLKSEKEKLSIAIHEYIHITEDKNFSKTVKELDTAIKLPDPPQNIKNYILNKYCENKDLSYQDYLTYKSFRDPQYYKNELNAYKKDKEYVPDLGTDDANLERDFRLWFYDEMRKKSEENYYK